MKLVRFSREEGSTSLGILEDGTVAELRTDATDDMGSLLEATTVGSDATTGITYPLENVRLEATIRQPGKIICLGLNYADHAEEGGYDIPTEPMLFSKATSSVIGPHDSIVYPDGVSQLDYEAELAIVIGKKGRRIESKDAENHILGYTAFNDVTARDVQYAFSQFFRGKSYDTFAPVGPAIVTPEEVDTADLSVRTYVNGELRQDSSTGQMIFPIPEIVASVSETMTLRPGDVIATGTPPGVGVHRDPPELLSAGDSVTVEIEGIGSLENTIVPEER